jgi:cyanophycinase-like exopeptidase
MSFLGEDMSEREGLIILFGSGETSPDGRQVFDWLFRRLPVPLRVAILETPAGFELNSAQVAGRIGDFMRHRLQNYQPRVTIVPARKRGTRHSPDAPDIAACIPGSDLIFLGPGSPTYAVRQLRDSLSWHTVVASQRQGVALALASAAAIAASAHALPVYEVYKVGEDPHWRAGLDLFGPYGLSLAFVPHWNNEDGGQDLDTSRCYMGQVRFQLLVDMLPSDVTVVGIDENTALIFDLAAETCQVLGRGGVTVLRDGKQERFERRQQFPIHVLGPFCRPSPTAGLPPGVWEWAATVYAQARRELPIDPPPEVGTLVERRAAARSSRDWATADALRESIADLGWQVLDSVDGPLLEPAADAFGQDDGGGCPPASEGFSGSHE